MRSKVMIMMRKVKRTDLKGFLELSKGHLSSIVGVILRKKRLYRATLDKVISKYKVNSILLCPLYTTLS